VDVLLMRYVTCQLETRLWDMVNTTCEAMSMRVGGCRPQIRQAQVSAGARHPVRAEVFSKTVLTWDTSGDEPPAHTLDPVMS
jgi:hypothetical protein